MGLTPQFYPLGAGEDSDLADLAGQGPRRCPERGGQGHYEWPNPYNHRAVFSLRRVALRTSPFVPQIFFRL